MLWYKSNKDPFLLIWPMGVLNTLLGRSTMWGGMPEPNKKRATSSAKLLQLLVIKS